MVPLFRSNPGKFMSIYQRNSNTNRIMRRFNFIRVNSLVLVLVMLGLLFSAGCATMLKPGDWVHVPVTTNPPGATLYIAGNSTPPLPRYGFLEDWEILSYPFTRRGSVQPTCFYGSHQINYSGEICFFRSGWWWIWQPGQPMTWNLK